MYELPIFEHFLSVGNLKPKLKWFFKPKLKPETFLLNWVPEEEPQVALALVRPRGLQHLEHLGGGL